MVLCALGQSVGYDGGKDAAGGSTADVEAHSWIDVMGFSVRVVGWRLTQWYPWDKVRGAARFGVDPTRVPTELYAHPADDTNASDLDATENQNLAGMPAHAAVQEALRFRLLHHFVPLARDARQTPPRHRGRRLVDGDRLVEQEDSQHEGRRWERWRPPVDTGGALAYSSLRLSLRNESGKRLQRRRERGAMLAIRRLARKRLRAVLRDTALLPQKFD